MSFEYAIHEKTTTRIVYQKMFFIFHNGWNEEFFLVLFNCFIYRWVVFISKCGAKINKWIKLLGYTTSSYLEIIMDVYTKN